MAAALTKTVAAGKTITQAIDGKLVVYTAGQTLKLAPQDAVVFFAAGLTTS